MTGSRSWKALVLVALTLLSTALGGSPAQADPNWYPQYLDSVANKGLYVTFNKANGTVTGQQWGGAYEQQWWGDWNAEHNTRIQAGEASGLPDRCLGAVHASWVPSGWIAEVRNCDGSPQQFWYVQTDQRLYNYGSSQCLELDRGAWSGYQVAMSPCRDTTTQWQRVS